MNATPYGWCLQSSIQRTPARCFWAACVSGARRTTEEPGATYRTSSMEVRSRRWRSRRPNFVVVASLEPANGGIFRSLDGGDSWSGDLAELGSARVYRHPHHHQSDQCQGGLDATVANTNARHVFRGRQADQGSTWTDIDRGQLPDVSRTTPSRSRRPSHPPCLSATMPASVHPPMQETRGNRSRAIFRTCRSSISGPTTTLTAH